MLTPDKLPINSFDLILLAVLVVGLQRGRKHGMSEELMPTLKWLVVLFGCAFAYGPLGEMLSQSTGIFGPLGCYILVYIVVAMLVVSAFALVKHSLGGKLIGSDVFGSSEYYLGMASGVIRFACVLLAVLALLNSRYYTPTEVRAMQKFQDDVYGSNFFPTLQSVQATVFEKSLTGPWIKNNLDFLLIKPTEPDRRQHKMREAGVLE